MEMFLFLFLIAVCGPICTGSSNVENRIAGGSLATDINEFGYMISLQQKSLLNTPTRGHRCGGVLVELDQAVTAAYCLFDNVNGNFTVLDPNDYRVFAGALDLTNDTSVERYRDIERFIIHPDYSLSTPYDNNIAVIKFESEFSPDAVRIARLANTDITHPLPLCTTSGWGSVNGTNITSTQLKKITKFEMANNENCQNFYTVPLGPQVTLSKNMICATTGIVPYSSCEGDLGNPLICNGNLKGVLIHAANSNCSSLSPITRPEIYTRIFSFRSWIRTAAGASTFQPGMAVLAVIAILHIIITTNVLN